MSKDLLKEKKFFNFKLQKREYIVSGEDKSDIRDVFNLTNNINIIEVVNLDFNVVENFFIEVRSFPSPSELIVVTSEDDVDRFIDKIFELVQTDGLRISVILSNINSTELALHEVYKEDTHHLTKVINKLLKMIYTDKSFKLCHEFT